MLAYIAYNMLMKTDPTRSNSFYHYVSTPEQIHGNPEK